MAEKKKEYPDEKKAARDKALYYLQFSDKTESEMQKKLAEQEFSPASIAYAINFLKEYHYLDDDNYVMRYIERNARKKSRRQMIFELRKKGIETELTERILEELPVDEEAQIMAFLEKRKYPGETASREERQKVSAALARKGFSYEIISSALLHYARKDTD